MNAQINRKKNLLAYSAQAAFCLGVVHSADAQVVYTDLDPDLGEFTQYQSDDTTFQIDLNADGFNDLSLSLARSRTVSYYQTSYNLHIYLRNFDGVAEQSGLPGSIDVLQEGDEIGPALNWNADPEMLIAFNGAGSSYGDFTTAYQVTEGGAFMDKDAQYVGLRFLIDGEVHYGWVRLSIKSNFSLDHFHSENFSQVYIMDYAFNPNADEPITINADDPIGVAKNVILRDVYDTESTSDIFIAFDHPASSANIENFRVIIVPAEEAEHVTLAEAMVATDYVTVETGAAYTEMFLPDGLQDINGDDILFYKDYSAIVLSVGNAASGFAHALSTPSFNDNVVNNDACAIQGDVTISTIGTNNDLSDYQVSFNAADFEGTIDQYRLFMIKNDTVFPSVETEVSYLESISGLLKYLIVLPDGSDTYQVALPTMMYDTEGNPVTNGAYYIRILGMRNETAVAHSCISDSVATSFPAFDAVGQTLADVAAMYTFNNQLFVQCSDAVLQQNTTLDIYAVSGAKVFSVMLTDRNTVININQLTTGFYIARLRNENGFNSISFVKSN